MNDRIRELAEQARKHFPKTESSGEFWMFDEQKFAQLIVKECITVCNSRVGNSDYNTGRMHCASDIRDHFESKS